MNARKLEFSIFCIESIAEKLDLPGEKIYNLLAEKSDILDNYIIPSYAALHTQGKEYVVNDIAGFMQEKGLLP